MLWRPCGEGNVWISWLCNEKDCCSDASASQTALRVNMNGCFKALKDLKVTARSAHFRRCSSTSVCTFGNRSSIYMEIVFQTSLCTRKDLRGKSKSGLEIFHHVADKGNVRLGVTASLQLLLGDTYSSENTRFVDQFLSSFTHIYANPLWAWRWEE